ncbi:TRAP transporter large permease subunit [Nocardiopsis coralliicola]
MLGIPPALLLLAGLLAAVAVLFLVAKRPIYECMAVAFVLFVAASGQLDRLPTYLAAPTESSLFYVIVAFMVVAVVFDATDAVDRIVRIMLALIGRVRGGAGYVALTASAFMASLSGSGPGNAAAVGTFTIPLMKRTGFRPAHAATIEMSASMLGNIIPPAGIIFLTYGIYDSFAPGSISLSGWLLASYSVGGWYLLQRFLYLYVLCRRAGVQPVPAHERPDLRQAWREGWPALLLPVVLFIPLLVDIGAQDLLAARLGTAGAAAFSDSVLMIIPGTAALYALLIAGGGGRRLLRPSALLSTLSAAVPRVVPIGATVYFAYAVSEAFAGLQADDEIHAWFVGLDLNLTAMIIVIPLFFAVLGMVLPGTAQVAILGSAVVAGFAATGGDPLVLAVLLPAMTGAMEGMTPPMALGLFVTMGIAGSGFGATVRAALPWVAFHLLTTIILLAGLLPLAAVGAG